MNSRIMTLVKMQLADKSPLAKGTAIGKKAIYIGLRFLAMLLLTVVFVGVFYFFNSIMNLRVNFSFLKFFICVTQIVSVIMNIKVLIDNLYLSKDNVILFSLPAKHSEVFLSKLVVFYISEFKKNLYILIPAMLAFAVFGSVDFFYFLNGIVLLIVFPLISVFAAAILSLPVMIIRNFSARHPIVSLGLYMILYGLFVYLICGLVAVFPDPFRMLAMYKTYMEYVNSFVAQANMYFILFGNAVNMMFAVRAIWDYVIVFASVTVLCVGVYLLAMPLYFRIVCDVKDRERKTEHITKAFKKEKPFKTFFVKEFKSITRNSSRLVSTVISTLNFPLIMYVINAILAKMNTNDMGSRLIIAFNIVIAITLLAGNNALTATAISSEGAEFAVLKTAPSKTYKIAWAKILLNLGISIFSIIIAFVILGLITNIGFGNLLMLFVVIVSLNTAHVFWSFQYDLLEPNLSDYALTGNLNNNKNMGRSMFTGVLMAVGFAFIGAFFLFENFTAGWIRLLVISIGFLILRTVLLLWNMKVYFKRIEM